MRAEAPALWAAQPSPHSLVITFSWCNASFEPPPGGSPISEVYVHYPETYHDEYNQAFEAMTKTVNEFIQTHERDTVMGKTKAVVEQETRQTTVGFEPVQVEQMLDKLLEQGTKHDTDKLPMHLLSTEALEQVAAVLQFGAQKYAAHNWRKGFVWSRPLSAALRHLLAFNAGEDRDPESGLSHLAHAACCIMFLLEFEKTRPELDDRYKNV